MMETDFEEGNLLFTDEYKKALEKASYEIVGNHSAVEICGWTKKGMKDDSSGSVSYTHLTLPTNREV